ncbi:MAG TPA: peptidoglycan DD-metalloendopeptidase family protein [Nocardioidaceae bacterium]|jgi:murein DD-endopeptidase MepM/ murein hydrolase activator NlpD|nr:peptidoglycan DD-metalloendopeptidase family protein [Nocardioidaceae bacterium]
MTVLLSVAVSLLSGLSSVSVLLALAAPTFWVPQLAGPAVPSAQPAGQPTPDQPVLPPVSAPAADAAVWPLSPRPEVVSGFSPPAEPWGSGHRGVDLLGRPGQPVHAAQAGTVTFAGSIAGVGVVVVQHGATRSTYQPVTASVGVGQQVEAGEVLGTLALFGSHCLPRACLHWGLLEGDSYLDPLGLVGAAPVRLLPLGAPSS